MRMKVIKSSRGDFEKIFKLVNIANWNAPLNGDKDDFELSVTNPYSKISCLLTQLYSMEIGSPTFYSEVNKAARDMDRSKLSQFGPFVQALGCITYCGEFNKQPNDKIPTGKMIGGANWNFAGSFLLWRGCKMQ